MSVGLIFKIAAVGILVSILGQVLKHSGREEQAFLVSLSGLILVISCQPEISTTPPMFCKIAIIDSKLIKVATKRIVLGIFDEFVLKNIPAL